MGSLSGLPYALAEAEQNFLVPTQTQALIWGDLVPQMILTARTARFWTVTPAQMHWVGMHMRLAEELIAEATVEPAMRGELSRAVDRVASPLRAALVMRLDCRRRYAGRDRCADAFRDVHDGRDVYGSDRNAPRAESTSVAVRNSPR